jgi:hypothetical protein
MNEFFDEDGVSVFAYLSEIGNVKILLEAIYDKMLIYARVVFAFLVAFLILEIAALIHFW